MLSLVTCQRNCSITRRTHKITPAECRTMYSRTVLSSDSSDDGSTNSICRVYTRQVEISGGGLSGSISVWSSRELPYSAFVARSQKCLRAFMPASITRPISPELCSCIDIRRHRSKLFPMLGSGLLSAVIRTELDTREISSSSCRIFLLAGTLADSSRPSTIANVLSVLGFSEMALRMSPNGSIGYSQLGL